MSFEFLFKPVEELDAWLTGLFDGAPLLVALAIAFVLGLRHASDPDHLVAVTSLVAAEDGDTRKAARLGAWWGLGHASVLVVIGMPLIFLKSELPAWLETGAEKAVGIVILVLAARVIFKWVRGDYRADRARPRRLARDAAPPAPRRPPPPRDGAQPGAGAVDRHAPRARRHRRRGAAADRRAALEARGGARPRRVRADVDRLDGRLHGGVRVDPHPADHRAGVPERC